MKLNRFLLGFIVIGYLLTACGKKGSDVGVKPTPTPTPAIDAFPPTGNVREDLKAVFVRFRNVKAFSQTDITTKKLTVSYIAPDRYKIESELVDSILIGKNAYVKIGDSWSKSEENIGEAMKDFHETFSEKTFEGLKEIKFAGSTNEFDQDLYIYTFKGFRKNVGSNYTATLTVTKEDGLPRKLKFDFEAGKSKPTTYAYYYKNIVIDPPFVKN